MHLSEGEGAMTHVLIVPSIIEIFRKSNVLNVNDLLSLYQFELGMKIHEENSLRLQLIYQNRIQHSDKTLAVH